MSLFSISTQYLSFYDDDIDYTNINITDFFISSDTIINGKNFSKYDYTFIDPLNSKHVNWFNLCLILGNTQETFQFS